MDDRRDLTSAPRIAVRRLDPSTDLAALAAHRSAPEHDGGGHGTDRPVGVGVGEFVWLDSGLPPGAPAEAAERARWSVLACVDGPFGAAFRHADRRATVVTTDASARWFGAVADGDRAAFAVLDDLLVATPDLDAPVPGCDFALGWVGYLGYELGRESGGPDRTADGHPDADLRFVDRAVVVDGRGGAWALALVDDTDPTASAANTRWLDVVATVRPTGSVVGGAAPRLPAGTRATARVTRAAHETAVEACREEIRLGNAFQVCLTTAFAVPSATGQEARCGSAVDPHLAEYLALRTADPVPFGAFLRLGSLRIASRSPERFLRISSSGRVIAEPIKGTRPRGHDTPTDDALRAELAESVKDRAENVMIVDLMRNDLLRTAVPGSVQVERLFAVESYATVHQLVSTVSATLPAGVSRAVVVRAAFPPGSMTGAPKRSAMAVIGRLEGAPRGVYAGVIGYFSANGAVDLSVAIRTLVTVVGPSGAVVRRSLGAGGAVTWSSVASDEADEVVTKTRSVLGVVGAVADW